MNARDKLLDTIQDALSMAVQADLEHGVKWLNECTRTEFATKYPNICQVIGNINDMEFEEDE